MHPWVIYANEISRDRERRLQHLAYFDEERWLLAQSGPAMNLARGTSADASHRALRSRAGRRPPSFAASTIAWPTTSVGRWLRPSSLAT